MRTLVCFRLALRAGETDSEGPEPRLAWAESAAFLGKLRAAQGGGTLCSPDRLGPWVTRRAARRRVLLRHDGPGVRPERVRRLHAAAVPALVLRRRGRAEHRRGSLLPADTGARVRAELPGLRPGRRRPGERDLGVRSASATRIFGGQRSSGTPRQRPRARACGRRASPRRWPHGPRPPSVGAMPRGAPPARGPPTTWRHPTALAVGRCVAAFLSPEGGPSAATRRARRYRVPSPPHRPPSPGVHAQACAHARARAGERMLGAWSRARTLARALSSGPGAAVIGHRSPAGRRRSSAGVRP